MEIENMIYEIRGKQVMLASDVAKLYHVETKVLNQTIKRNINRFPEEFCFQISYEELNNLILRSQIVTSSWNSYGGTRYLPYVLTEQGIMMLSGLLRSDIAVKVNIQIIDAFVKLKRYVSLENKMLINHENRILKLEDAIDKMNDKEKVNSIFFDSNILQKSEFNITEPKNLEEQAISLIGKDIYFKLIKYLDDLLTFIFFPISTTKTN